MKRYLFLVFRMLVWLLFLCPINILIGLLSGLDECGDDFKWVKDEYKWWKP